jgi:hypothetical protein
MQARRSGHKDTVLNLLAIEFTERCARRRVADLSGATLRAEVERLEAELADIARVGRPRSARRIDDADPSLSPAAPRRPPSGRTRARAETGPVL